MHTGKQKQMNASYQASLVNRHIRRFSGYIYVFLSVFNYQKILVAEISSCVFGYMKSNIIMKLFQHASGKVTT